MKVFMLSVFKKGLDGGLLNRKYGPLLQKKWTYYRKMDQYFRIMDQYYRKKWTNTITST